MGPRRTLAEELADLATPGPVAEADFEGDELSGAPALLEDFEIENAQPSRKAREKKSQLRADIELQNPAYNGRRTSRAAAFDAAASEDDSRSASQSDDESDQMMTDDEEDAAGVSAGEAAGVSAGEEADSDADGAASSKEDDRQGGGSSGEEDHEDSGNASHSDDVDDQGVQEDDEAAELERQYAEVAKQDQAALASIKDRTSKERTKGLAVLHQKQLWEKNLELRILLQKCLTSANRLPHGQDHSVAVETDASLAEGYRKLAASACETIDSLLGLQTALTQQHPAAQQSVDAMTASKRKREPEGNAEEQGIQSAAKWQRIDTEYSKIAPFRDASIDRWHRKTMLISGSGALKGNLRALNQSVSSQVSMLMKDPAKLARRSGVAQQQRPRALCHMDPHAIVKEADPEADDALDADVADEGDEEVDLDMFDDGEFYAQLLKEFLEGSGAGKQSVNGIYPQGKKKRKQVDRRASKGRKLRYHVQEKLVNFMAPVEQAGHELAVQLFTSLFGGSKRSAS